MTAVDPEKILAAMDSQVEEIRHQAVRRAGEVLDPVPLDLLQRGLGDESWRVRKAATQLALKLPVTQELLGILVSSLASEDNAGLRNCATEVLIQIGAPCLETVAWQLSADDRDLRKFAADILGEIGQPEAIEPLTAALQDEDDNVRGAAAEALGRIGDSASAPALIGCLQADSLLLQLSALDGLHGLDAQVSLDLLVPLMSVRPLRPSVFRLLGIQRNPGEFSRITGWLVEGISSRGRAERTAATRALVRQVRSADRQAQVEVRVAVARAATDELCSRLRELLDSAEDQEREAAVAVLGWTGRVGVVPDLLRAAANDSLREAIHEALLAIGPKAAKVMAEMVGELGNAEKVLVVEILAHFRQPGSLPRIVEMCLDTDSEVADAAQRALGQAGDPTVIPTLVALLGRGTEALRAGAIGSLVLLGERFHDQVISAVEPLLDSGLDEIRAAAAVIAGVAQRSDQSRLEQLAGDQDPRVRTVAIRALGRVGAEDVVDRLRMVLTDENPQVRAAAARALGERIEESALSALQVVLGDADAWVVSEAIVGLGRSGASNAIDAVLPFSEHQDVAVALEAVRALNRLGWPGDQQRLVRICRNGDPEVIKELLLGGGRWSADLARATTSVAIDHPRWDVRMAAVRAIGEMRDQAGLQVMAERLPAETDPLVREAMEQVLQLDQTENR